MGEVRSALARSLNATEIFILVGPASDHPTLCAVRTYFSCKHSPGFSLC